ncbi:MAG: ABC transporter substrate-binding protein [Anaerolineae bacterium]
MSAIAPPFAEKNPDVTVNLQAIGYGDLFAKLLPSIAAGTEGDVLMLYTNWVVATDVTKVFLDITEPAGGAAALGEKMWPAAFNVLDVPEGKVYYLPWLAGIRGAVVTVNTDHMAEKSIDYLNWQSYDEIIEAGKSLTQKNADGKITRAGYSPRSSQYVLMPTLMWQMGGAPYDKSTGKWSFNSAEGEQAAQFLYDIYWKHETCDFELFQSEYEAVSQKLVSIWGDGAWTASVQKTVAGIPTDNIPTPKLANAAENIQNPDHIACWGLSKRLAGATDKLKPAIDFAMEIVGPDALILAFDFYSGVCMTKAVYQDPRIEKVQFGLMSKRVAEGMWPVARYNQDHVADHGPAATELDRAMRKEISIKEALTNMDAYLQEQEDAARERIGI